MLLRTKNKFGSMDNISYLYVDIEILADQYELEQEILSDLK